MGRSAETDVRPVLFNFLHDPQTVCLVDPEPEPRPAFSGLRDDGRKQKLGRDPSVEELAAELDVPVKKVENMIQVARRPLSLETPTDDEEDSVLGDFIEDDEAPAPSDSATYNLLKEHLQTILNDLPPREVRILQLRYGLLDGQAYTLEEVGNKMGVTRERVRQREAQALARLRHPSVQKILRDYLRDDLK